MNGINARSQRGLTLVEMMIALVLGLLIIAAAIAVFISNQKVYTSNSAVSQVQDNARIAFELIARDIRQASVAVCGPSAGIPALPAGTPLAAWTATTGTPIRGYNDATADPAVTTGTGLGDRLTGTDSVELLGAGNIYTSVSALAVAGGNTTLSLNPATTSLDNGDLIIACNPQQTIIAQATGIPADGSTLTVAGATGNLAVNAQVSKLVANDWYIGTNAQDGHSLYRMTLENNAGVLTTAAQEMVRNVTNMQIFYHDRIASPNTYIEAAAVGDWTRVNAIQLTLTLQSIEQHAGTDTLPLQRTISTFITLRNQVN